ncbi:MAG: hypothetical protein COB08_003380 [Rhodobacteraceae bacterium]|nr:hypothetical protein [Paracoccaceae bacterium]
MKRTMQKIAGFIKTRLWLIAMNLAATTVGFILADLCIESNVRLRLINTDNIGVILSFVSAVAATSLATSVLLWHIRKYKSPSILSGLCSPIPTKIKFADSILLFVCKPDDAEVAAGDLLEELEKVKARHGRWYCNIWFIWELALLVVAKGRARFTKSVFGPLVDLWKRKSS